MSLESFSYEHKKLGSIDVEIVETFNDKICKEIIEVNIIHFKDGKEYYNFLTFPKEAKLTYNQLQEKINIILTKR